MQTNVNSIKLQTMETKNRIENEKPDESGSDPSNWKWSVFYYNKNDKRIFPPKRNKYMGWTVNFANPVSVVALVSIIILISMIAYLISHQ